METAPGQGSCQSNVDAPRLHNGVSITQIVVEYSIHFGERVHHSAADRQASTRQTGSSSSSDKRNVKSIAFHDDPDNIVAVDREHNDVRRIFLNDVSIASINDQFVWRVQQSIGSDNITQTLKKLRRDCGGRRKRRCRGT
jgi:hypothetical protein